MFLQSQILQIQKQFKSASMSFKVLNNYESKFPAETALIASFQQYFQKKLWNQLTLAILKFIYNPQIKGKVCFDFYTEFVHKFQKNIDQINLLKIIKQCIVSLSQKQQIQFLKSFQQKQAFTEETKAIVQAMQGLVYVSLDFSQCSQIIKKIQKVISTRKDVDSLVYSAYYEFSMRFFSQKRKYKLFYTSALQFLAYTPVQEIDQHKKISMLVEMAVAALASDQIYNFSELLEQPSLVSLKNSNEKWMYDLLEIFNKGDILRFERFDNHHNEILKQNKTKLESKIRIMAFLELVFNLPKNNRVVKFHTLAKACAVPEDHVEFMIMKAMALKLIKGSIDQLAREVTITWVAPKVLQNQRIGVMQKKFQQWENGVQQVYKTIKQFRSNVAVK